MCGKHNLCRMQEDIARFTPPPDGHILILELSLCQVKEIRFVLRIILERRPDKFEIRAKNGQCLFRAVVVMLVSDSATFVFASDTLSVIGYLLGLVYKYRRFQLEKVDAS